VEPDADFWVHQNRAFIGRAMRWALDRGIRRVLDIGSGLPDTVGSPHHLIEGYEPAVRIVYVDIDPVAVTSALFVAHARAATFGDVAAFEGDLRRPTQILTHPTLTDFLDLGRPVVVLLGAVLHFIADADDPSGILAAIRDAVAPGSVLVVSHAAVPEAMTPEQVHLAREYSERTAPLTFRSRGRVAELLAVFGELVEPGVCKVADWHPAQRQSTEQECARLDRIPGWVGVAVKGAA
jgi:SAM-dependent methyltransferase